MIVAKDVERPVHDEAEQLFAGADALALCIIAGYLGANIHVADDRPAPPDPGESEGDDVSGPVMTEVALVQTRYRRASDKSDGKHCVLTFSERSVASAAFCIRARDTLSLRTL